MALAGTAIIGADPAHHRVFLLGARAIDAWSKHLPRPIIRHPVKLRHGLHWHVLAQRHVDGIHNLLAEASSNATAESINADIQSAIARTRGFRTFRNLRTVIYLLHGTLDLPTSPCARAT